MVPGMLLRVDSVRAETQSVKVFELVDPQGMDLIPFTAGSHVELALPNGMLRRYSLCNDPREKHRYELGVLLQPGGGGGSRYLHERVAPGDLLQVSAPRNRFPLDESALRHVLIAGGIGVTPLLSMAARLQAINTEFVLHDCTRDLATTAFQRRLFDSGLNQNTRLHHDGGHQGGLGTLAQQSCAFRELCFARRHVGGNPDICNRSIRDRTGEFRRGLHGAS